MFFLLLKEKGFTVEARWLEDKYYVGIESCQRKRDEKYLCWTVFRGECPMRFGDGELVNWEELEFNDKE